MTTFAKDESKQPASPQQPAKELEISAPQRVVHSGHVGFGANGLQLSGSSVPPELRMLMARLDEKLAQMGATQLTPEEQDSVLRRMLTGPRTTVKPGQIAKISGATTGGQSGVAETPSTTQGGIGSPTLISSTSNTARPAGRGPTANAINNESLKMLTALLKERDDRIRELEAALRDAKSAQLQAPSGELAKLTEEKRALTQQKRDLEQQVAQLKSRQAATARQSVAPNADISKLVEERIKPIQAQAVRENEALKARLAAMEKERDELVVSKAKLELELSRANTRVVSASPSSATASSSAELKRLETALNDTTKQLKAVEAERTEIEAARRTLQAQVDSLTSQIATKDSKSADAEAAVFQAKLNELTAAHAKTQESLRAENQMQREQLSKIQQQLTDAELALQSAKAAETNSGSEISAFRTAMQAELDAARAQSAQLDKANAELEQAKDMLQSKLDTTLTTLEAEKARNAREAESHTKLTTRIADLESTLATRTKENQTALDATKAQLTAAQAETSKFRAQLDSLATAVDSSSEISALEEQLNSALTDAKQAQARLATAISDKERVAKSNADLEARLRQLTEELQAALMQQQSSDLSAELAALEKELNQERNLKNKLEDEKDALEASLIKLNASISSSADMHKDSENQLREARKELEVLRAQLSGLEDMALASTSSASLAPPPPAPAPPPPSFTSSSSSSSSSSRAPASGMNQSLLDSIKNPEVALKRTSQILHLPPEVTDGDDILAALARRIIDRRGRMKGGANEPDEFDEDEW
jgi:chromosome segregation ATPase